MARNNTTYNKRRHICREGKVKLDGTTVLDSVKFSVVSTPEVAESKGLGERVASSRYVGMAHKVTVTFYKSTKAFKKTVQKYIDSGVTPEFTITGIDEDDNRDYYDSKGYDTVTCKGCVITSDITLLELDTEGEYTQEELEFAAYQVSY